MAIVQKPINQSITAEKSGPPAWKQLPTWFQISESDHLIPPDTERLFAKRMNATTVSVNSSHASLVSHPDQIAELILNATKGRTGQVVMVKNYSSKNTALLIVDPFNEMIFYQRVVNYGFFRKKPSKALT